MGCTSCSGKINGVCKVCELLDQDEKVKKYYVLNAGILQMFIILIGEQ